MSAAAHIIDGFDLNDGNCAVTTFEPETPTHVLTSGSPGRGCERLTRVTTGGFRRHHYIVEVTGTSKEDIEANIAELISHLPMAGRGPLNLVRIASDGLTAVTDVAVAIDGMFSWPYSFRYDIGNIAEVEFTLVCTAYATLSPVADGPTSLTTPCVVDLSAMTGEYPGPLDMLFSAPDTNDLTEFWVAYVPADETAACAWADALSWIIEAESLSWTNGTAAVVAYANPTGGANNAVVTDGNPTMYADFDMAALPISSYGILARAKASDAGCYMWTSRAGISGLFTPLTELPDNGPFAVAGMGSVRLPTKAMCGAATDLVRFSFSPATGDSVSADRLFTMPTRWGAWHWKAASGHKHAVERVGETLYVSDTNAAAGVVDMVEVVGAAIEGLRGRLLIVAQGTSVTEATHAVALTYTYTPRLTLW